MKATPRLIGTVAILLAACEGEKTLPDVQFSAETVTLAEGAVTLRVPAGWMRVSRDAHPIEYDAERYAVRADRWATCKFSEQSQPNPDGAAQAQLNQKNRMMPLPALKGATRRATLYEVTNVVFVGDVNFKTARIRERYAYTQIRTALVLAGEKVRVISLECGAASPPALQDQADIEAFLGSVSVNPKR